MVGLTDAGEMTKNAMSDQSADALLKLLLAQHEEILKLLREIQEQLRVMSGSAWIPPKQ